LIEGDIQSVDEHKVSYVKRFKHEGYVS